MLILALVAELPVRALDEAFSTRRPGVMSRRHTVANRHRILALCASSGTLPDVMGCTPLCRDQPLLHAHVPPARQRGAGGPV